MLAKNIAGQGAYLYAYLTTTGLPKTGDAANITGNLSLDGSTPGSATATAHPTEIAGGLYWQPLSQAETNANALALNWSSTTTAVLIAPLAILTDRSALPNAAAGAAGGLPLGDAAGRVDVSKFKGTTSTGAAGSVGIDWAQVANPSTAVSLSGTTVGTTLSNGDKTGYTLATSQSFNNTGQTNKLAATIAAGDGVDAAAIKTTLGAAGAGLTAIPYTGPAALTDYQQRGIAVTLPAGVATSSSIAALSTTLGAAGAGLTAIPYTGPAALTDYQQRGIAVTLPTTPPAGYGGSAGTDPWSVTLPGAYGAGTAGAILGTNLNATVSSRLPTSGYTAPPAALTDYQQRGIAVTLPAGVATSSSIAALSTTLGAAGAGLTAIPYTGPAALTDYQQRGIAVTLPTTAPAGYGGSVDTGAIALAVWNTPLPGTFAITTAGGQCATIPYLTSAISGVGFTLDARDQMLGAQLAGWQATFLDGSSAVILNSNTTTNQVTLRPPGWPHGTPTVNVPYALFAPIADRTGYLLDLTQPLPATASATVGGALLGSWSTAFGRIAKNTISRILSLFGPPAITLPVATFLLDDANNPTNRTPQ